MSSKGVTDAVDPLAGSYWVEHLTAELERRAQELIDRIDAMGGMLEAIETGWAQQQIHEAAYRWQREVESNTRTVVGLNAFAQDEPTPAPPFRPDPATERARAEFLGRWRAERAAAPAESGANGSRRRPTESSAAPDGGPED